MFQVFAHNNYKKPRLVLELHKTRTKNEQIKFCDLLLKLNWRSGGWLELFLDYVRQVNQLYEIW